MTTTLRKNNVSDWYLPFGPLLIVVGAAIGLGAIVNAVRRICACEAQKAEAAEAEDDVGGGLDRLLANTTERYGAREAGESAVERSVGK